MAVDSSLTTGKHYVFAEVAKETFDQVKPRGTGGGEVQFEAWMFRDPGALGCLCVA
jgi:hypothetical protein